MQALDPRARLARLTAMDDAAYRRASFLDDRMLPDGGEARICSLDDVVASALAVEAPSPGWIFHIGHVGSTLVSRLLGELGGVLSLREPRSLRDLAAIDASERPKIANALAALMGRRLEKDQIILVKATSFVSDFAPLLVAPDARALFLFTTPRSYIQGILAGPNSVIELRTLANERVRRLGERGLDPAGLDGSDAHLAAAAWLCEMTVIETSAATMSDDRAMFADFDRMLSDLGGALSRIAAHFGIAAERAAIDALLAGPILQRYSKAQEYDYSPALRAELLAEAGRDHRVEIDAALAGLGEVAARYPLARRALDRAGREA